MAEEEKSNGADEATKSEETQDKTTSVTRYFALYRYQANRPRERSGSCEGLSLAGETTVSEFLDKEATADGNFSLSVVATSLSAENETDLRKYIAKRLSRGTVYSGSGNVATLELNFPDQEDQSVACYYCLLRQEVAAPAQASSGADDIMQKSYCSNDFVVCFITKSDNGLDLFRPELDKYSTELLCLLDADLSGLDTTVRPYLERWHEQVMEYVSRCLLRLGQDVKYLIHAALLGAPVEVEGGDPELREDIQKFVDCCSLSELLTQITCNPCTPQSENGPSLLDFDPLGPESTTANVDVPKPQTVTLKLQGDKHIFSSYECTKFCEDWASAMMDADTDNAVNLRQMIDNYKLQSIQDMNTLKRLIRQAETDHYALYRCYVFLKNCGNGSILLQHARLEDHTLTSPDAKNVLQALDEYIQETGGLPKR